MKGYSIATFPAKRYKIESNENLFLFDFFHCLLKMAVITVYWEQRSGSTFLFLQQKTPKKAKQNNSECIVCLICYTFKAFIWLTLVHVKAITAALYFSCTSFSQCKQPGSPGAQCLGLDCIWSLVYLPIIPGRPYLGPGPLYSAAIGPLGLWGLQDPTHTSRLSISVLQKTKKSHRHARNHTSPLLTLNGGLNMNMPSSWVQKQMSRWIPVHQSGQATQQQSSAWMRACHSNKDCDAHEETITN